MSRLEIAQTFAMNQKEGEFEARFVPEDEDDFIFFCRLCLSVDDILYVIDEGGLQVDPRAKERAVYSLATLGGHWEQDGIWVTQQPKSMPTVLRSQADEIYFFQMKEVNDIDWSRNYLGDKADELPKLPVGHCFRYTLDSDRVDTIRVDITSKKLHIIEV